MLIAERYFRVTVVAIDKSRLAPVTAIPTGIATPEAKAAFEFDPVITVVMMSPVSATKMVLPICLTFASFSCSSISIRKNFSILHYFCLHLEKTIAWKVDYLSHCGTYQSLCHAKRSFLEVVLSWSDIPL